MKPVLRACLRRLRLALLALAAGGVILLGVLAGITQLAMPWFAQHPRHVEKFLSSRLQREVSIGHLDGRWIGGGPVLALDDVRIAGADPGQAAFSIPHAELAFDLLALLRRNEAFSEFRIAGAELRLAREGGRWSLRGFELGDSHAGDEPLSMGALGAIELTRLRLAIDDVDHDRHWRLSAPVLRVLNRGTTLRVLARVREDGSDSAPLDVVAELDPATRSGELYAGGGDVDLSRVLQGYAPGGVRPLSGRGALQLWAWIRDAQVDDVRVRVDQRELVLASREPVAATDRIAVEPRSAFARLAFVARWMRHAGGWSLDLAGLDAGELGSLRASIDRSGGDDAPRWRARAAGVPIDVLGRIAMHPDVVPPGLRRWLYLAHPRGTLEQLDIDWVSAQEHAIEARLRAGEASSVDFVPGIDTLDAELVGDAGALLVHLPAQSLRVEYPRVFRQPFAFAPIGGDIVARPLDEGWRIETARIGFEGEGYGGELRGSADILPGRRPTLDLAAVATHGEVVAAKRFWPTNTMPPDAVKWLDRALVGGEVAGGRVAIRGDLADWPFHDRAGRFIARGEIEGATLAYDEAWPAAEQIDAVATFVNDGMSVEASRANSMGVEVGEASATIEDFGPLVLELAAKGKGSGQDLLAFLRATPIGRRWQEQIQDVAVGGRGEVAMKLVLPIHQVDALTLDGSVALAGAKIDHAGYGLHFGESSGTLRFDQTGFAARELQTTFRERKALLSVAVGGHVSEPRYAFEASVSGSYPVSAVFSDVPTLLPLLATVQGESPWTARVAIDAGDPPGARKRLTLDSTLSGTAIGLPAPLAKDAGSAWPFHLELALPPVGQAFHARLGELATIAGRVPGPGKAFAARVQFGGLAAEPPETGVVIGGRVAMLDGGGWLDLAHGGGGSGADVPVVDLHADDFQFGGRHFAGTDVRIAASGEATTVRLDAPTLSGSVEVPRTELATRGITARFARVHWPDPPADAADAPALSDVAPGSLPPLHIAVDDFQLGSASFGSARFESRPIPGGMQVETMQTHSPNVTMEASGDWTGGMIENRSRMSIQLSAHSLGRMMDALGFPGLIDGGQTRATIDASWLGPPSAFALAKLDGTLAIDVAEGRILDVEPGAGRLFGLFSLTEIPRRLSLDFSDFFKSGLGFNSIKGTFRLAGGNAYTDGLRIDSPAADIVVTGRTGLRTKDYDQRMDVRPRAGATLPIVGAIAAGPVGAAAGLVVQGIFNKPIGKAVTRRYQVTGSWEKPVIVQIARTPAGAAAAAPAAPAPLPDEPPPWQVAPIGPDGDLH